MTAVLSWFGWPIQSFASAWIQLIPTGGPPPARHGHSSVYDPASNRLIVFGGCSPGPCTTTGPGVSLNDLWVLTNANGQGGTPAWMQLTPTGGPPPARFFHVVVYDSANNRMVIRSGDSTFVSLPDLTDVWVLTNANGLDKATGLPATPNWSQLFPTGGPPPSGVSFPGRESATGVYDSINNRMIVFGGGVCDPCTTKNDVWVLTNANGLGGAPQWLQLLPMGGPPAPRGGHSAVYDAAGDRMMVFGAAAGYTNDTWVLANANGLDRGNGMPTTPAWTQLTPTGTLPPPRSQNEAAYDAATNRMVIFGGTDATSFFNDVWLLDNANGAGAGVPAWSQILPTGTAPAPRYLFSRYETYDAASKRMLVFGGSSLGGSLNDSWVLTEANGGGATLEERAAAQAKALLGQPYIEGGKGYDMATKNYNPPYAYVSVDSNATPSISSGYLHCIPAGCPSKTFSPDKYPDTKKAGIDCSGLVFWSFNTAAGASTTDTPENLLSRITDQLSIDKYNNSTIISSVADAPWNLQPGDLLFFRYEYKLDQKGNPVPVTHVAMHVGNGQVAEAYDEDRHVIPSSLIPDSNKHTRANYDPFPRTDLRHLPLCGDPNVGTNPCFQAYGRLNVVASRQFNIQFGVASPVALTVTDPDGYTITPDTLYVTDREMAREIPGQLYCDVDSNGDDQVFGRMQKTGNYLIGIVPKPDATPTDTYSLTVKTASQTVTLAESVPISEIPTLGYGIESTGSAIQPFIPVAVEIKPGGFPNSINPHSNGTIPVAILSNATFDALSGADVSSLGFGRTGNELSLGFCDAAGEDVNGDGLPDLVCHFYAQETGFQAGDIQGTLRGRSTSGELIRGADSVVIVP